MCYFPNFTTNAIVRYFFWGLLILMLFSVNHYYWHFVRCDVIFVILRIGEVQQTSILYKLKWYGKWRHSGSLWQNNTTQYSFVWIFHELKVRRLLILEANYSQVDSKLPSRYITAQHPIILPISESIIEFIFLQLAARVTVLATLPYLILKLSRWLPASWQTMAIISAHTKFEL